MAYGDQWQVVNTSQLKIRTSPNITASISPLSPLSGGEIITEAGNMTVDGILWIHHAKGWSATKSGSITYLSRVGGNTGTATNTTTTTPSTSGGSTGGSSVVSGGSSGNSGTTWKVINAPSGLKIRSDANMNASILGTLTNGEIVEEISRQNVGGIVWVRHSRGWSASSSGSTTYLVINSSNTSGGGSSGGGSSGGSTGGGVTGGGGSTAGTGSWAGINNISRSAFRCTCGGTFCDGYNYTDMNMYLVKIIDDLIGKGYSVTVSSAIRCPTRNTAVGGVANSRHITGNAVDFAVSGWSGSKLMSYLNDYNITYKYIIDGGYVHMDQAPGTSSSGGGSTSGGGTSGGGTSSGGSSGGSTGGGTGTMWMVQNAPSGLTIRTSPSVSASAVGTLSNGQTIEELDRQTVNGIVWIKHSRGWSASASGGEVYLVQSGSGGGGSTGGGGTTGGGSSGGGTSGGTYNVWSVVNTDSLRIRSSAGLTGEVVGALARGEKITELDRTTINGVLWIKHQRGWSAVSSGNETYLVQDGTTGTIGSYTPNTDYKYDDNVGEGYQPGVGTLFNSINSNISDSEFIKMKNVAGVFGLPYQFLPQTDVRIDGSVGNENIGYEYAERIVERIPLLFLIPGKANFMTRYSKNQRQSVIERFIQTHAGISTSGLDDLLTSTGRYYTFETDRTKYYKYVNPMCRIAARYLNVHNVMVDGYYLDNMDWGRFTDAGIRSIGSFSQYGAVPFYVDAETSISESFENSTGASMLDESVNGLGKMARELTFLLGYGAAATGVEVERIISPDLAENQENIRDMVGKLMGRGNFLNNVADHLSAIGAGGKLIFPEIWNDSSFSRSYSCTFKFVSPDPSNLSVYLNVIVPLLHLIGLVAPQSLNDNPNAFVNPFLIRAVYKGLFNVDMGIITNMEVTKGAECQWTPEGIPTSINVTIGIKDLYSAMSITATDNGNWAYGTTTNTALMDYIANLCGINIFEPEIGRQLDIWFTNNVQNRVNDFFPSISRAIQDKITNIIGRTNIFR